MVYLNTNDDNPTITSQIYVINNTTHELTFGDDSYKQLTFFNSHNLDDTTKITYSGVNSDPVYIVAYDKTVSNDSDQLIGYFIQGSKNNNGTWVDDGKPKPIKFKTLTTIQNYNKNNPDDTPTRKYSCIYNFYLMPSLTGTGKDAPPKYTSDDIQLKKTSLSAFQVIMINILKIVDGGGAEL